MIADVAEGTGGSETGKDERKAVAVVGGTGYVGRLLLRRLVTHPLFRPGPVVGSESSKGKLLSEVWVAKEAALHSNYGELWEPLDFPPELESVRVVGAEEVTREACDYAVSCVAPEVGEVEDEIAGRGVRVVSISPWRRKGNVCVVELAARQSRFTFLERRRLKSPNCVVCGASLVLKALDDAFGLEAVCVTTMQSISGRGDAMYSGERIVHNVMPVANSGEATEACIRSELRELFPGRRISVRAYRVGVHVGHTIDVRVRLRSAPRTREAAEAALEGWSPLPDVKLQLPSSPSHPILVVRERGAPQPRQRTAIERPCSLAEGMQVMVGNVAVPTREERGEGGEQKEKEEWDVCLTLVVNNLIRGAYGAAIQMMEYREECLSRPDDGRGK